MLNENQAQSLETVLNSSLPDGFDDFDDFADTVLSVISGDPEGREWTISPHHTGQREDPNSWNSPMIVGVEIELPHVGAIAIYDGFSWSVSCEESV